MTVPRNILLAPSLLSANFANFNDALATIHKHQAPWVHFDVMDGQFVPNITFGSQVVASLRQKSSLFFDVHLMTLTPERQFLAFAKAGANNITFHVEATMHAHALVQQLHQLNVKAGMAINPGTALTQIENMLPFLDVILVMSVNPGAGGQALIQHTLEKAKQLKELKAKYNYHYVIEMDGGINQDTIEVVKKSGVEAIVVGSAFFENPQLDTFLKNL